MGWIKARNQWATAHSYFWIDLIRIGLGVLLIVKGVEFMSDPEQFGKVMQPFENWPGSWIIMHYVISTHFIGGFFLIFGLFTRISVAFLFPVSIGAVIANALGPVNGLELVWALVTLAACLYFFFNGPGKRSADHYLGILR
jgi:uncharacterized membrane protein YphA (DoxX/SURF4 family)